MSDSTPTEPLGAPTRPLPVTPEPAAAPAANRRMVIVLASVGGALLVALLILLGVLIGRGGATPVPVESQTPSTSPTPTETSPSPTPTPTPSQTEENDDRPDDKPGKGDKNETSNGAIKKFEASVSSVDCSNGGSVPVHFEWRADGVNLWFGVGTDNAKDEPYGGYKLKDELDIDYQCGQASKQQRYTVTAERANGDLVSATLVITE